MLKFIIPIIPKAQARSRSAYIPKLGRSVVYKARGQSQAEDHLTGLLVQHRPAAPLTRPVHLCVRTYHPVPKSWPKKRAEDARAGRLRPTSKPDLDNLIKNIKDCLTALHFWADDRQVVEYLPGTGKYYDDGQGPRWEIEIQEAGQ